MRKLIGLGAVVALAAAFAFAGAAYAAPGGVKGKPGGKGGGNTVTKTLTGGPTDSVGDDLDLDFLLGLPGGTAVPDANDAGAIGVTLFDGGSNPVEQFYSFTINIGNEAEGNVVFDAIPAEWDLVDDSLVAALHDVTDLSNGGATCRNAGDTADVDCDADDGLCHDADGGVPVTCASTAVSVVDGSGNCSVGTSQPPGASAGSKADNDRHLQPEFVTAVVGSDEGCTVLAFVVTDGNPGHFDDAGTSQTSDDFFTLFEPTGCLAFTDSAGDLLEDGDGDPIVDTIGLNSEFKIFSGGNDGERLYQPT